MNNFSKEFCWTIKRFYPLGVSLILLGFAVEEFKSILPPILEGGYVTIIQVIITIILLGKAIRYFIEIKYKVKSGLSKHEKISFFIFLYIASASEAVFNSVATNVFLLNLFPAAYGIENPTRETILLFSDYVWGLILVPIFVWYYFRKVRKYLTEKLEKDSCTNFVCLCTKNWIYSSLGILIILNLVLILVD